MLEYPLENSLKDWLIERAEVIDQEPGYAEEILGRLASQSLFGLGVAGKLGGVEKSTFGQAFAALVAVAKCSLNAAFILWAQRGVIDLLAQQPEHALSKILLPLLIKGRVAGAPGLSNLIKFGSGLEPLRVQAKPVSGGWELNGQMPWVSNAQDNNFIAVVAAQIQVEEKEDAQEMVQTQEQFQAQSQDQKRVQGQEVGIFLLPNKADGVQRRPDWSLYSIQSSATASIGLEKVRLSNEHLIATDAFKFMSSFRPPFLAQQCALSVGVALASLEHVIRHQKQHQGYIQQARALEEQILKIAEQLILGVTKEVWVESPQGLFELRLQLAALCSQSAMLEMQIEGGAAYVKGQREATRRRLREALLLPLITPTVAQLS